MFSLHLLWLLYFVNTFTSHYLAPETLKKCHVKVVRSHGNELTGSRPSVGIKVLSDTEAHNW